IASPCVLGQLDSFPTRRSSDLSGRGRQEAPVANPQVLRGTERVCPRWLGASRVLVAKVSQAVPRRSPPRKTASVTCGKPLRAGGRIYLSAGRLRRRGTAHVGI